MRMIVVTGPSYYYKYWIVGSILLIGENMQECIYRTSKDKRQNNI